MARSMTCKGVHPTAVRVETEYPKGVRQTRKEMRHANPTSFAASL